MCSQISSIKGYESVWFHIGVRIIKPGGSGT